MSTARRVLAAARTTRVFVSASVMAMGLVSTVSLGATGRSGVPAHMAARPPSFHSSSRDSLPNLTRAESRELRGIVLLALRPDTSITAAVRRRFWSLADRVLATPGIDRQGLRDRLAGELIDYPRFVYEDALRAAERRSATKSSERQTYEERLQHVGLLSSAALDRGDSTVQRAAAGDSILVGGRTIPGSPALLEDALDNLTRAQARLDSLFTVR